MHNMKDTLVTVFKDLYKSNDIPYIITLEKVVNRIRKGTSKDLIKEIRSGDLKQKNKLPSVLFAGEFEKRSIDGLKSHNGLSLEVLTLHRLRLQLVIPFGVL